MLPKYVIDKIKSRLRINPITECHEWTGSLHQGYGYCHYRDRATKKKRGLRVHRVIMENHIGRKLARKELVCHECGNRTCANPSHLYIGTYKSNANPDERLPNKSHNETERMFILPFSYWDFILSIQKNYGLGTEHEALKRMIEDCAEYYNNKAVISR